MSRAIQADQQQQFVKQRSVFRLSMIADEPVYLLLSMDGVNVDPIIDELGGGGARLVSAKHFEMFYEGQIIGPAVLVLPDEGMPVVYPVVKWKSWPIVGVEFMEITEKDREMILRFLFKVERRMVQSRPKTALRKNSGTGR
jgi:c-di-GMP-binding flagellar brake protein YcgR